jgi:broad specificity phosphatase PhoE
MPHRAQPVFLERRAFFITHPNVAVNRDVPVPQWPLTELGMQRMRAGLAQPWVKQISAVYSSAERKALDGAAILAEHLGLGVTCLHELGENDRSSTGFLPPDEFERVADQFFAHPEQSARGWETACAAQSRVLRALAEVLEDRTHGSIAIISHGAVGALLYCHLAGKPISRQHDQPANGGGNYYSFPLSTRVPDHGWRQFDAPA